jgi:hypothetical protein
MEITSIHKATSQSAMEGQGRVEALPDMLLVQDIADFLRVDRKWVYRHVQNGKRRQTRYGLDGI